MKKKSIVKIYLGYGPFEYYNKGIPTTPPFDESKERYIHPEYDYITKAYDLALVRMTKPIDSKVNPLLLNSICLPEKWSGFDCYFKPFHNCMLTEYGMVSGWGTGLHPPLNNLQIGYWKLFNYRWTLSNETVMDRFRTKMAMNRLSGHTVCSDDSGGPVWQYDMGRAVIAGVQSSTKHDSMDCEISPGQSDLISWNIFVDQQIDWIKSVAKHN